MNAPTPPQSQVGDRPLSEAPGRVRSQCRACGHTEVEQHVYSLLERADTHEGVFTTCRGCGNRRGSWERCKTTPGQIPTAVLENAERRLRAGRQPRLCVTPGCDQAATHSPCTGHDSCELHRIAPPMPKPDPARTLNALRALAEARGDQP